MSATALIGLQWGDEGKGKLVDMLAPRGDVVVRCQGGSNAGHTVKLGGKTLVLHLVPSGILSPDVRCVIGNGVVLDPASLLQEIETLQVEGVEFGDRFFISDRAHVVLPYHRLLDQAQESARGGGRIGTTGRGIGPTYEDKVARSGIRVGDLLSDERLERRLDGVLDDKRRRLGDGADELEERAVIVRRFREYGERLRPWITDTVALLLDADERDERILMEGAQGSLLDVDLGTYPFVTSSNAHVGGLLTGSGLPASSLQHVIGVTKAYSTRVGEGPYPTELHDAVGDRIRERGGEFGSTTGRPRRCGWLDLVALRFAVRSNGVDTLIVTKADVLSGFDELKVATSYRVDGVETGDFPSDPGAVAAAEPVYKTVKGWTEDISSMRGIDELPRSVLDYVALIEEHCGVSVQVVSVGPGRDDIIHCIEGETV